MGNKRILLFCIFFLLASAVMADYYYTEDGFGDYNTSVKEHAMIDCNLGQNSTIWLTLYDNTSTIISSSMNISGSTCGTQDNMSVGLGICGYVAGGSTCGGNLHDGSHNDNNFSTARDLPVIGITTFYAENYNISSTALNTSQYNIKIGNSTDNFTENLSIPAACWNAPCNDTNTGSFVSIWIEMSGQGDSLTVKCYHSLKMTSCTWIGQDDACGRNASDSTTTIKTYNDVYYYFESQMIWAGLEPNTTTESTGNTPSVDFTASFPFNTTNTTTLNKTEIQAVNDACTGTDCQVNLTCNNVGYGTITFDTLSVEYYNDPNLTTSDDLTIYNRSIGSTNKTFNLKVKHNVNQSFNYTNFTHTLGSNFTISANTSWLEVIGATSETIQITISKNASTPNGTYSGNIRIQRTNTSELFSFPLYLIANDTLPLLYFENTTSYSVAMDATDSDTFTRAINNSGSAACNDLSFYTSGSLDAYMTMNIINVSNGTSKNATFTISEVASGNYNEYLFLKCDDPGVAQSENSLNLVVAISSSDLGGGGGGSTISDVSDCQFQIRSPIRRISRVAGIGKSSKPTTIWIYNNLSVQDTFTFEFEGITQCQIEDSIDIEGYSLGNVTLNCIHNIDETGKLIIKRGMDHDCNQSILIVLKAGYTFLIPWIISILILATFIILIIYIQRWKQ